MNRKHVLVTGAGGYIGRHVVSTLLDFGMQVTAVDIRTEGIDERAKAMQYDIFNGYFRFIIFIVWHNITPLSENP